MLLSTLKYDLYIGIGILIRQKWQKCLYFRHISKFQLVLLENYTFEFLYQVLNWLFHTATRLLHWTISGLIPYIGSNSSIKISIDNFFRSKMRLFFKIKCCMLNLSFLLHLDRKCRSATAPLVISFRHIVFNMETKSFSQMVRFFPMVANCVHAKEDVRPNFFTFGKKFWKPKNIRLQTYKTVLRIISYIFRRESENFSMKVRNYLFTTFFLP